MSTPAQFYDQNGELRLDGSLVGGGGALPVTARAQYSTTTPRSVSNGASTDLDWDLVDATTPLLDVTDPQVPLVVADGLYAITATVLPTDDMTVGGYFEVDINGYDTLQLNPEVIQDSRAATAAAPRPKAAVSLTYWLRAGDPLYMTVINYDGSATRHFVIDFAFVQKLSS